MRALCCLTAFTIAMSAPAAHAADQIDVLIEHGVALREQGKDAEALIEFRKAYEISHSNEALAQMALAEYALGRWLDAETHLTEALVSKTDAWVNKNRAALEGALAAIGKHLGTLEIVCDTPGAEVSVDGTKVGALPFTKPLRVVGGSAAVTVRAAGYLSATRTVSIEPGGRTRETFSLVAIQPEPLAPTTTVAPSLVIASRTDDKPESKEWRRTASTVAFVTAGVFGVAGATGIMVQRINASHWNDDSCVTPGMGARSDQCAGYRSTAQAAGTIGWIGLATAGVLGVVGVVFVLTAPTRTERRAARVDVLASPGSASVRWSMSF